MLILFIQSPTDWIGKEITPGRIGFINHGGLPKILTTPGRYPGFPLRNWWAREWHGTKGRASSSDISYQISHIYIKSVNSVRHGNRISGTRSCTGVTESGE